MDPTYPVFEQNAAALDGACDGSLEIKPTAVDDIKPQVTEQITSGSSGASVKYDNKDVNKAENGISLGFVDPGARNEPQTNIE